MRACININSGWSFLKDTKEIPTCFPTDWEVVNVPHTWNNIDGMDGGSDYFRGTCNYAKVIKKAELSEADRYYLEINGAASSADVYVNGKAMAHHDGGYSTWRVDITEELTEETLVVVAVDNTANDTVYPQVVDFTFYGGMYRDVNIIAVADRFGCRTFEIHPENGFILNGEEYPLRGVSRHQDRIGFGNALLKEHHDEDMDLICEVGDTTIRLAHYQHDQYFYNLCDESYRLVEKNAILNWFDITEKEGYCSLNTPISDIMATFRGKFFIMSMVKEVTKQMKKNKEGNKKKGALILSSTIA